MIINSESVARELMDKRSAIYSDRPVVRTNELYVLLVIIQQDLDLLTRQDWNGFQYYIPSVWRHTATTPHDLPPSPEG
jgi:hypothetical protein